MTFRPVATTFLTLAVSIAALAVSMTASADSALGLPLESEPFARKGPAVLTHAELDAYLSRIPEEHRGAFLMSNQRLGKVIDDLILVRLLAREAISDGLLDDRIVQGSLAQTAKVLLSEEYRSRYLQDRLLEDYEQPARELYLTEPELFESPKSFDFSHILIMRGSDKGELQAMEEIFAIYEKLQEGAEFQALVQEYSEDPNASENNGQYKSASVEELEQNVSVALSVMEPGQISEPVLSSNGWHILRLDAKHEPEQQNWEEAEERALELAENRHRNRLVETLFRELLGSAPLEIKPGAIEALMERHGIDDAGRPTNETVSEQTQGTNAGQ